MKCRCGGLPLVHCGVDRHGVHGRRTSRCTGRTHRAAVALAEASWSFEQYSTRLDRLRLHWARFLAWLDS